MRECFGVNVCLNAEKDSASVFVCMRACHKLYIWYLCVLQNLGVAINRCVHLHRCVPIQHSVTMESAWWKGEEQKAVGCAPTVTRVLNLLSLLFQTLANEAGILIGEVFSVGSQHLLQHGTQGGDACF